MNNYIIQLITGLARERSSTDRRGGRNEGIGGPRLETQIIAAQKAAVPLDESNIGNKLLKSMGWQEGKGLGRHGQGMDLKNNNLLYTKIRCIVVCRYCRSHQS